jgi:hypothetical protein
LEYSECVTKCSSCDTSAWKEWVFLVIVSKNKVTKTTPQHVGRRR